MKWERESRDISVQGFLCTLSMVYSTGVGNDLSWGRIPGPCKQGKEEVAFPPPVLISKEEKSGPKSMLTLLT